MHAFIQLVLQFWVEWCIIKLNYICRLSGYFLWPQVGLFRVGDSNMIWPWKGAVNWAWIIYLLWTVWFQHNLSIHFSPNPGTGIHFSTGKACSCSWYMCTLNLYLVEQPVGVKYSRSLWYSVLSEHGTETVWQSFKAQFLPLVYHENKQTGAKHVDKLLALWCCMNETCLSIIFVL